MTKKKTDTENARSIRAGAIALVFLVLGYQAAIFVHKAAVTKIISNRDHPDTVYVVDRGLPSPVKSSSERHDAAPTYDDGGKSNDSSNDIDSRRISSNCHEFNCGSEMGNGSELDGRIVSGNERESDSSHAMDGNHTMDNCRETVSSRVIVRKQSEHSEQVKAIRDKYRPEPESFRFNPNTVSVEDLQRLGFSEKQAEAIDNYRQKGGHFARKSDFAKSFVVSEDTYKRLEPFIDIPLLDLNRADSTDLVALPGIGGWYASQIIRHRAELGGYSSKEQLLNVYRFDRERYNKISDLVFVRKNDTHPYPLWSYPADSLRKHPYIRKWETARAIVLFRDNTPPEEWTLDALLRAGILTEDQFAKLSRTPLE